MKLTLKQDSTNNRPTPSRYKQIKTTIGYLRGIFKRNTPQYESKWRSSDLYKNISTNNPKTAEYFQERPEFNLAFRDAYKSKSGFVIRWIGGKEYMIIRGTRPRMRRDWAANVADMLPGRVPGYLQSKQYNLAAKLYKPDVVLGHSRGGYLAARMSYNKANNKTKYVGFDAAMRLTKGSRERNLLNLAQNQPIDKWLGRGGKHNVYAKWRPWRTRFHAEYHSLNPKHLPFYALNS